MSLTSPYYAVLLIGALILCRILPKSAKWLSLLLASAVFYVAASGWGTLYIVAAALVAWASGLALGALDEYAKKLTKSGIERVKRWKKLIVFAAVFLTVGLLYTLKYLDFTLGFFGIDSLGLLLPLGISFYTLQAIGYVVDCYRAKYAPERNFAKFALFVAFFVQVIQGPIGRYDRLAPQLFAGNSPTADSLKSGLRLMLVGYLKKLIVADRAAVLATAVFDTSSEVPAYESLGGVVIALGVLAYCIELYFDFSGGIDIVRGSAMLFGIELDENFRRPFFATSLADYWRRWHITLGTWMKDYVFYPLALSKPLLALGKLTRKKIGGRLGKIIPTSAATFTIYFIIGIWHGASFKYVAYGLYNGILLTLALLFEGGFKAINARINKIRGFDGFEKRLPMRIFSMARTLAIVFIGRYITRAHDLSTAVAMLTKTFAEPEFAALSEGILTSLGLGVGDFVLILSGVLILLGAELLDELGHKPSELIDRAPIFVQWLALFVPILALTLNFALGGEFVRAEFIYQQY